MLDLTHSSFVCFSASFYVHPIILQRTSPLRGLKNPPRSNETVLGTSVATRNVRFPDPKLKVLAVFGSNIEISDQT